MNDVRKHLNRFIRLLISDINSDLDISFKICRAANYYSSIRDMIENLKSEDREKLFTTINIAFSEALLEHGKAVANEQLDTCCGDCAS